METIERAKGSWWWIPAVGVVYLWLGAAAVEIISTISQILALPAWIARASLALIGLGLPLALVLAARAKRRPKLSIGLPDEVAEAQINILEQERDFYRSLVEGTPKTTSTSQRQRDEAASRSSSSGSTIA